jgi:hypothetical protein
LLVAVAWSGSEADAKLPINEVGKGFWLFEHGPIRLVN